MSEAVLTLLVEVLVKYGPVAASAISAQYKKLAAGTPVSLADVDAIFADCKPYEAYGIPDVAPKAPGA